MEYELALDKKQKYLVGASGGSDSMTLLSLCVKKGYEVVVCHVNYKLRKNADKEEALLKKYCAEHNVSVYTYYPKQENKENFQKWARDARYGFYKEIYDKEGCSALLLGHQKDDSIENYLMSQERGSHGWYYGIPYENDVFGMHVIRPLLQMRKKETRTYCIEHNVPFGDDESNFSDKYTRNRIRHSLVEPASQQQIEEWQQKMNQLNQKMEEDLLYCEKEFNGEEIILEKFIKETPDLQMTIVRWYLWKHNQKEMFSSDFIKDIVKCLNNDKNQLIIPINDTMILVKEYGKFYISEKEKNYSYTITGIQYFETEYFLLSNQGTVIQSVNVEESDFPITIRNAQANDVIEMRFGHKKVNRFFIDRKIPYKERIVWPVIENRDKKIIFVKDIGCDVHHFSIKPNLFMIE